MSRWPVGKPGAGSALTCPRGVSFVADTVLKESFFSVLRASILLCTSSRLLLGLRHFVCNLHVR